MNLSGFGIFNHFISTTGLAGSDADILGLTPQSGFSDTENHTHASPFMDASINAHAKIFEDLPYFRNYAFFEDARLVASAGYLYLGNVARPYDSVNYVTFPINPSIDIERDGWELKYFTVGMDFTY